MSEGLEDYPLARKYGWRAPMQSTGGIHYVYPPVQLTYAIRARLESADFSGWSTLALENARESLSFGRKLPGQPTGPRGPRKYREPITPIIRRPKTVRSLNSSGVDTLVRHAENLGARVKVLSMDVVQTEFHDEPMSIQRFRRWIFDQYALAEERASHNKRSAR